MKEITIEINGTGTHNRGAELMAIAVRDRLLKISPNIKIVVPPDFGKKSDIKKYGFLTTNYYSGKRTSSLKTFIAKFDFRGKREAVDPKDIDLVLDASGFQFSDQWGHRPAKYLFKKMRNSKRAHQKLILLPQAFGPFSNPKVITWVQRLFERCSHIYARDLDSLNHCKLINSLSQIDRSPDFTIDVAPIIKNELIPKKTFASIVPNFRMLDKTNSPETYLNFINTSIKLIIDSGIQPVFVLHDAQEDFKVLEKLDPKALEIPVITDSDPRVLKGILGESEFVIGSRFHALVSSLSQGIPCIGVGWSHKYPELFNDFKCNELLISDMSDISKLKKTIQALVDKHTRNKISKEIENASTNLKIKNDQMWLEIEKVILKLL